MRLSVINAKFEWIIGATFGRLLSGRGYERNGNQFYCQTGRVGKLLTIQRDPDHTPYRQVAVFTLTVDQPLSIELLDGPSTRQAAESGAVQEAVWGKR